MTREIVLMRKDEATMNVPTAKLQIYLADGWVEVSRTQVEETESVAVETHAEVDAAPKEEKPRARHK